MRESFICEGRDCRIQITPALLDEDGRELVGTRVCHWSDPMWYAYVNPAKVDAHGMIDPDEQRYFAKMADEAHERAGSR